MTGELDFTNCKQIPGRAYNGAIGVAAEKGKSLYSAIIVHMLNNLL